MIGIAAAAGQPAPPEDVTVTAAKSREAFSGFAKAFAKPTRLTGKIARWETGICPLAVGQGAALTGFVTARIRAIAVAAGAPVNGSKTCTPNIEIVFTSAPQDLLDNIRKHDPDYLGYAESNALREKLDGYRSCPGLVRDRNGGPERHAPDRQRPAFGSRGDHVGFLRPSRCPIPARQTAILFTCRTQPMPM